MEEKLIIKVDKVKDPRFSRKGIKMRADQFNSKIKPPLPTYNFFSAFIGRPASGKTTLAFRLFNDKKFKGSYFGCFDKIYLFSKSLGSITDAIHIPPQRQFIVFGLEDIRDVIDEAKTNFIESIEEEAEDTHQSLLIFDDCISLFEKNIKEFLTIAYNRRNIGVSIMLISQKWNKIPLELREAISEIYLFKPNTRYELSALHRDLCDDITLEEFRELCHIVYDEPHIFMLIKKSNDHSTEYYRNFKRIELKRETKK
jgi:GTPase SAR1 family protein